VTVAPRLLAPILDDLQLAATAVEVLQLPAPDAGAAPAIAAAAARAPALVVFPGLPDRPTLARLRDACWPGAHFGAIWRVAADGRIKRMTSAGDGELDTRADSAGGLAPFTVVLARSRQDTFGQQTTRAKFDANATGWNGNPGSPTYGHYRWMRRLLAEVAQPRRGQRTLDAGSGTGWVGIEAARLGASVAAFDPSPAMIELAKGNAAQTGVPLDARVGFVENAPFDKPFELVLNSGVISFAPDPDVYLTRLDRLVEPGGTLVIGDINPLARGFLRRRRVQPLLPARELNGLTRPAVEALLVQRGYVIQARRFYQLTFPVPQLMALSEKKGLALPCAALLALNKLATATDAALFSRLSGSFDSWILRARKPA